MYTNLQIEFHQQMQKKWAEALFFLGCSPQRPKRTTQVYRVPVVHPSILITSGLISQYHQTWIKPEVSKAIKFFANFQLKKEQLQKEFQNLHLQNNWNTAAVCFSAAAWCSDSTCWLLLWEHQGTAGEGRQRKVRAVWAKGQSVITSSYLHSVLRRKKAALINKIAMKLRELSIILWLFKSSQCWAF